MGFRHTLPFSSVITMIPFTDFSTVYLQMVVTDVYNHRFHKVFVPDEGLSHILDRDDIFM